jgi:predicted nucleic acid-binding protein
VTDYIFDSNVLVADLLQERTDDHLARVSPYTDRMKAGGDLAHMPSLGLVEVCGAVFRQAGLALALSARAALSQWVERGSLAFHDLNETRANQSANMAMEYGLAGADATFAALSGEMGLVLVTLDDRSLADRLRSGGYPLVVVP